MRLWHLFYGRMTDYAMYQLQKVFVFILSLFLFACGSQDSTAEPSSGVEMDAVSLVDNLRAAGAIVNVGEAFPDPLTLFMYQSRHLITVNDQNVQIFEFFSSTEADAAAQTVSPSGFSVSRPGEVVVIEWIGTPHFYKTGRVIVLYVGDEPSVLSVLKEVLGLQFAGR